MARIKNVEAFCNVCGIIQKMELSPESAESVFGTKRWAKCRKCKQMMLIDIEQEIKAPITLENIQMDNFVEYSPDKSFNVGESVYHKGWNDIGVVKSKEILGNGRSSILVEFQKSGQKKLIEKIQ